MDVFTKKSSQILKSGDLVKVRTYEEIKSTLDETVAEPTEGTPSRQDEYNRRKEAMRQEQKNLRDQTYQGIGQGVKKGMGWLGGKTKEILKRLKEEKDKLKLLQ